jgi:hypothetical protein
VLDASRPGDREPFEKKVPFSNLTKVFWPEEGYTKGDLITSWGRRSACPPT